jgi:hypothetical protein
VRADEDGEAKLRNVSRECESDGDQDEGEEGAGQELEEHDSGFSVAQAQILAASVAGLLKVPGDLARPGSFVAALADQREATVGAR